MRSVTRTGRNGHILFLGGSEMPLKNICALQIYFVQ